MKYFLAYLGSSVKTTRATTVRGHLDKVDQSDCRKITIHYKKVGSLNIFNAHNPPWKSFHQEMWVMS